MTPKFSSQTVALIIGVLALLWVLSGLITAPDKKTKGVGKTSETVKRDVLSKVRVSDLRAENFAYTITVTGRSKADRHVEVKSETSGMIDEILVDKGAVVKAGDILARLEIRDRQARLDETRQRVSQREIEFNAAQSLENKGFNSRIKLAEARADLEMARTELKQAQIDLNKREIKAPFDGIINERPAEIGDFLSVGDPVFSIVDLDPLKISAFIAERDIQDLTIGSVAHAEFLNGKSLSGTVSFIALAAQEQARTFEIEISIPNTDFQMKEGFTATVKIPVAQRAAYKISPSILSLDEAGKIGLKIIDQGNTVKFMPVRILADEGTHMRVDGLPANTRLIIVGQEFVMDGQVVDPVSDETAKAAP
jgi:multidrug efflux system membrane fusion protein